MKHILHKLATAAATGTLAIAMVSCGSKATAPQDKMLIAGSFWDTIAVVGKMDKIDRFEKELQD